MIKRQMQSDTKVINGKLEEAVRENNMLEENLKLAEARIDSNTQNNAGLTERALR